MQYHENCTSTTAILLIQTKQTEFKMKYHVFNKKPSQSAIEAAMKSSCDPQEQSENLALATFPEKGELWQNENTGRVIVVRSQHLPIQGTGDVDAIDCYGVVVADVIGNELEVDFDIFFTLRQLVQYKKVGRLKKKLGAI